MIVKSTVGGLGGSPGRSDALLVAALDVEWTKNYRIVNGNRVFCYSVVWISAPYPDQGGLGGLTFDFTSVYAERADEDRALVDCAATELTTIVRCADVLVGHQLCSDLAVLAANSLPPGAEPDRANRDRWEPPAIALARALWHTRSQDRTPRVIDTRFDAGSILTGRSRRLVDVCTELGLDVTQPELAGMSMTALHREWLEQGNDQARERISVLNLRHSLSTALVALRLLDLGDTAGVNVNLLLLRQLHGRFGWIYNPAFQDLVRR